MDIVKGPTLAQSHRFACEVLRPVVHVLRACGIPESVLRVESERAYGRYARISSRGVWTARACFPQLARILTVWSRDPAFIDEAGSPRRLPLGAGAGSFAALLRKAAVSLTASEAIGYLQALECIRRCDRGRRVRLASNVLLGLMGSRFLAAPMLDAVRRFAETAELDLCGRRAVDTRMHRWADCARVDPRQLPELQRFVRSSGQTFLEAVDEKLLACAVPRRGAAARRTVRRGLRYGVGVYVHLDEAGKPRAGGGRRSARARPSLKSSRRDRTAAGARGSRSDPSFRRRSPPRRAPVRHHPASAHRRAPHRGARSA
jgi:hypothetical protein